MLIALGGAAAIFCNDSFLRRADTSFVGDALTDEPAHAVTTLLAVAAVAAWHRTWRTPAIWAAALLGGTAIDLDHLPDALGWHGLSVGSERPYTHALWALALPIVIGLCQRGARRRALLAAALGLASHLARDMVEGSASVPLLWPLTRHGFAMPYAIYASMLVVGAGVIGVGVWRHDRDHELLEGTARGDVR